MTPQLPVSTHAAATLSAERLAVLLRLGRDLSVSTSAAEAADLIATAADNVLGWDAYSLTLFEPDGTRAQVVHNFDVIDGRRTRVPPAARTDAPSSIARRVLADGPLLLLPEQPSVSIPGMHAFGDTSRPSAALLFVPLRSGPAALGILSIQSYTPHAYTAADVPVLQALADHCAGALERLRAAAWHQHRHARSHALLTALPDLLCRFDRVGQYLDLSGSPQHLLAPRATCIGQTVHDVLPQSLADQVMVHVRRAFDTQDVQVFEYEAELNGAPRHEEARIMVCGDNDVLCVVRDITERKRMEAATIQARKQESLGVLAAGIAHVFNNLLMVMLGNAELAQLELPEQSAARVHLEQIQRAAHQAAQLTRQMLVFAGHGAQAFGPLDVSAMIDAMQEHLASVVGQRARVDYQLQRDLPPISGDAEHLHQLLGYLVANATDAVEGTTGHIRITTGSVELHAADLDGLAPDHRREAGRYVYVEVADNGRGMDSETQARMFDPFYATTPRGSGVSLAAVVGIVRGHGGTTQVRSAPGAGTTVRVVLPVQRAP